MSGTLKITTDLDFTPAGKRRARIVQTSRGGHVLRWYVGGRRYRMLAVTAENLKMSKEWVDAGARKKELPAGIEPC